MSGSTISGKTTWGTTPPTPHPDAGHMAQEKKAIAEFTPPAGYVKPSSSLVASLLGMGADLGAVIFALQIQKYDEDLNAGLKEIDNARKQREALNTELDRLRNLKSFIANVGDGSGDERHVDWSRTPSVNEQQDNFKSNPEFLDIPRHNTITQDPKTGAVTVTKGEQIGNFVSPPFVHRISLADVDKAINAIQSKAQTLDSDREIKMIMLNQLLNKKEQATTQLTNLIKKTHDTRSAIVSNLK